MDTVRLNPATLLHPHRRAHAVPRSGAPSPALSPRNTFRLHTHPPHRSASIAGGLFHFSRELSSSIRGERLPGRRRSQQRRQLRKAHSGRERARSFMLACDGHQVKRLDITFEQKAAAGGWGVEGGGGRHAA